MEKLPLKPVTLDIENYTSTFHGDSKYF
jgi:hypothetical protein